jgi:hypothetical protein
MLGHKLPHFLVHMDPFVHFMVSFFNILPLKGIRDGYGCLLGFISSPHTDTMRGEIPVN